MDDLINWDQFERDSHEFPGNYRAIVENNKDPERAGRVQVRLLGLHSPFSNETPTEHLLWAEPAPGLYWSGGHNIKNPDASTEKTRYITSGSEAAIPNRYIPVQTPPTGEFTDPVEDDCGTGAVFTVPRKGTIVWVFFENNDHTRCHYFAASPKAQDWIEQDTKITSDINAKRDTLVELRTKFTPDKTPHMGSGPAAGAVVNTFCSTPRVNIYPIDDINPEDITSITSSQGTTIIIVNQKGKERIYVMNKGTGTCIDEWGHKKEIVGVTKSEGQSINCNDEKIVAGHSELHVIGDYDLYAKGNIFIQSDANIQINGKHNIGIVVREGDADIVVESGNVNIASKNSNVNVHSGKNVQVQSDINTIIKSSGNTSIEASGSVLVAASDISLKSTGALTLEGQSVSIKAQTQTSIEAGASVDVQAGSQFKVDASGFGGNVAVNVPISNAFHTGTFPGPGAGPGISVLAVVVPIVGIPSAPFIPSIKKTPIDTTPNEKNNATDTPKTPANTGDPT